MVDYLRDLGVTAVELLPVHHFVSEPAVAARGLCNYWGYNTLGFFAPHAAYSSAGDRGQQVTEFKAMVKAFHDAGIEVLLDVVYNHTAEAGADGPTLSLRGLDDRGSYHRDYLRSAGEPFVDRYWDVTGCGNTVNVDTPHVLGLILDSLRYWVTEMHVDGFRFDLASALTRVDHEIDLNCHLIIAIGQDPVLRHVKLVAEAWDVSMDGYRVGDFPPPWVEWNDQYRDEIRDFWRGHLSGIRDVATRLSGSSDLYADDGRSPYASVNFVTAHDGFPSATSSATSASTTRPTARTTATVTRQPVLQPRRRGRDRRPGDPRAAPAAGGQPHGDALPVQRGADDHRRRRARRTQGGNNNPYCQDNEISWIDWRADDAWLDVYAVTRAALHLRRRTPRCGSALLRGPPTMVGGPKDLAWLHPSGREMTEQDWHDPALATLGMFVSGSPLRAPGPRGEQQIDASFVLWFHSGTVPVEVDLPENDWVHAGEVVLSTDPALTVGAPVSMGERLTLGRAPSRAPQDTPEARPGQPRAGLPGDRPAAVPTCRTGPPPYRPAGDLIV